MSNAFPGPRTCKMINTISPGHRRGRKSHHSGQVQTECLHLPLHTLPSQDSRQRTFQTVVRTAAHSKNHKVQGLGFLCIFIFFTSLALEQPNTDA